MTRLLLALALAASLHAAPKWLRKVSAIAVCAGAALDTSTTIYATAHGAREQNPLLANHQGGLRLSPMIAINAGMCGAAVLASVTHRLPDRVVLPVHAGMVAVKAYAGLQNVRVIHQVR